MEEIEEASPPTRSEVRRKALAAALHQVQMMRLACAGFRDKLLVLAMAPARILVCCAGHAARPQTHAGLLTEMLKCACLTSLSAYTHPCWVMTKQSSSFPTRCHWPRRRSGDYKKGRLRRSIPILTIYSRSVLTINAHFCTAKHVSAPLSPASSRLPATTADTQIEARKDSELEMRARNPAPAGTRSLQTDLQPLVGISACIVSTYVE